MTPLALEMLLHLSLNEGFDVPAEVQDELIGAELVGYMPKDSRWFINSRGQTYIDAVLAVLTAGAPVYQHKQVPADAVVPEGLYRDPGNVFMAANNSLPEGYTPVKSVEVRGKFPPGLTYDTHVAVIYRDGKTNKRSSTGTRPSIGEAALFNWKHAGPDQFSLVAGQTVHGRLTGNPDDDIVGYALVAPPENKMAMPKAAAS